MTPLTYRSVKDRAVGGAFWQLVGNGLGQFAQLVVLAALARQLGPADFGLVGMGASIVAFLGLVAHSGLSTALVQMEHPETGDVRSFFTASLFLGGGAAAITWAIAPWVAGFFDQGPLLVDILRVSSLSIVLNPLATIPRAVAQRQMRFGRVALADTVAKVLSGAVSVCLAFRGWGLWSLVARPFVASLLSGVILMQGSGVGLRFRGMTKSLEKMATFTKDVTLFEVFNYWSENVDYVLIGKFLGPHALGAYTMAYNLASLFNRKVTGLISSVSFTAFSRLQAEPSLVRSSFIKSVSIVAFVLGCGLFFLSSTAEHWVVFLYGQGWEAAILPLALLSVAAIFHGITYLYGGLFLGMGRADLRLRFGVGSFVLQLGLIAAGLWWVREPWGVAAAIIIQSFLTMIWGWRLSESVLGKLGWRFVGPMLSGVLIAFVAGGTVRLIEFGMPVGSWPLVLACIAIWCATCLPVVAFTRLPGIMELRGVLRDRIGRKESEG